MYSPLQILFLCVELCVMLGVVVYLHAITLSLWRGAPYVPTASRDMDHILASLNLRKGMKFLELGCGDGRVVCRAVKEYGVVGRGVDVSRLWLLFARIRAWKLGIRGRVEFLHQDIRDTDLAWADVIYLYMMPRFIEKYGGEIVDAIGAGTVVVTHSFPLSSSLLHVISQSGPAIISVKIKEADNAEQLRMGI